MSGTLSNGETSSELAPDDGASLIARNTFNLVREIRHHALKMNDLSVYALMVFDCAMLQLGGLAIQSRQNKIARPDGAVKLADVASKWLLAVVPELATSSCAQ
jgi:hypothetical protein